MTDEILEDYINNFLPIGTCDIQLSTIDGHSFTFLVHNSKAIGAVLDMSSEPHVYILKKYRGNGNGTRLLEKYLIRNDLVKTNKYVYYYAGTVAGKKLIEKFRIRYGDFTVIEVEENKYIILKDFRFRS